MEGPQLSRIFAELIDRFDPSKQVKKSFESAYNEIWNDLLLIPEGALEPALKRLKTMTNYLPSAEKVLIIFQAEGKHFARETEKQRTAEWDKTKGYGDPRGRGKDTPEEVKLTAVQMVARGEHAKLALNGFRILERGGKSEEARQKQLEFFKLMDSRYPNAGWAVEGLDQQKWYQKRKLL